MTTSGTLYLEFNGSSYVAKINGATIFSGTDTTYSTFKNSCPCSLNSGDNGNIILLDNFRAADLVTATGWGPLLGLQNNRLVMT